VTRETKMLSDIFNRIGKMWPNGYTFELTIANVSET
jgi:hypothetical protein